MRKKHPIIILLTMVAVLFFIYCIFYIIKIGIKAKSTLNEDLPTTKDIYGEYKELIKINQNQLRRGFTYHSKVRNPISTMDYDSMYSLLIYKMDVTPSFNTGPFISLENHNIRQTPGLIYRGIDDNFMFKYRAGSPDTVKSIILTVFGESLKTIALSDTLVNYVLDFKKFSISYEKDGKKDIFGVSDDEALSIPQKPLSILFLKRRGHIYLLIMSSIRQQPIPEKLLYNLVTGNKD